MTEKPVAIVLPTWNPNEPRFIIEDCPKCSNDRVFKNGKCVFNQRLGFAYSVDEIVEVLNNDELEKENDELKKEILILSNIKEYVNNKIDELEHDLQLSVKAGMPTGSFYSEIELLEEIKEIFDGDSDE